jgi:hypothetical protein
MRQPCKNPISLLLALSALTVLAFSGCEKKTEGEKAIEKVGDAVEDAVDEVGDAVDDATE